jgi:hypothetical protein
MSRFGHNFRAGLHLWRKNQNEMSAEEDELREFLSQYRKTSSTPRVGMRKWGALDVSVWINKDGKRWRKSFGHLTHILGGRRDLRALF